MSNPFLDKIEPYLQSDERIVQEFVLQALEEYPFTPAEWTNRILEEALQKEDRRAALLIEANPKHVNENSIPILLNLFKVIDKRRRHSVINYFINLQPEAILEHEHELSTVFGKDFFTFHRLLITGNKNELQDELENELSILEDNYDHRLYLQAKKIQDRLIINRWYDEELIDNILEEELKQPWFSYRGVLAIRAAGRLQLEKHIPFLAELLEGDDDLILEEAAEALIRYQSDKAAEAVAPYARNKGTFIYAINVLANTKTKHAEEALISSYPFLDADGKAMVIEGLAHHLSDKTFPFIEDYMKNGYFTQMFEMESIYYGIHTVLGRSHPDMKKWKANYEEKEKRFNQMKENLPIIPQPKIGRNDKCPCGSGKKYKKCCGA